MKCKKLSTHLLIVFLILSCNKDEEKVSSSDCDNDIKFEFHHFSNVENDNKTRVDGITNILKNIDLTKTKLTVPIHYILYPSSGLTAEEADLAATKITSLQYPGSDSESKEKYKHTYDDLFKKLQKEAITADLPEGSCGGSVSMALPPALQKDDYDNYYAKVALHEYHHIFQNTPIHNNSSGNKEFIYTWMTEGTAEYWAQVKFTQFGNSLNKDIATQTSEIVNKLKQESIVMDGRTYQMDKYRKMSLYNDEFGDSWPIHSTEIGYVITYYMITIKNKKLDDIIQLYEKGVVSGRKKALEDFLGIDYVTFENEFETWIIQ